MNVPSDPAELQSYILDQLLARPDDGSNEDARAPAKFAKQLAEAVDLQLKDRLFHEIQVVPLGHAQTGTMTFASEGDSPVTVLYDGQHKAIGFIRTSSAARAALARVCFGGDIQSELLVPEREATESEAGMQQIFSKLLAKALETSKIVSGAHVLTLLRDQFDPDEFEDQEAFKFSLEIRVGKIVCDITVALRKHLVVGHGDGQEASQMDAFGSTNDEMMQTPVVASVKLKPQPATLRQIRELQVGDCLPLINEEQLNGQFIVSGQELFDCQIGRSGDSYSLKISSRAESSDVISAIPQSG